MKTNKRLIILVIILLNFSAFCNAQARMNFITRVNAVHQQELKECPYIVEGKVLKQWIPNRGVACSTMQITKIFRGLPEIHLGSIKVITSVDPGNDIRGPSAGIFTDHKYIIFGNCYDSNTFQSIVADNSPALRIYNWIILNDTFYLDENLHQYVVANQVDSLTKIYHLIKVIYPKKVARWGWRDNLPVDYTTMNELYSFFKANGLEVQAEVEQTGGTEQK